MNSIISENTCRLCLTNNTDEWHSISFPCVIGFGMGSILIRTMIVDCLSLSIEMEDNLPKIICADCLNKISDIYDYRQQVKSNNEFLKNVYINDIDRIDLPPEPAQNKKKKTRISKELTLSEDINKGEDRLKHKSKPKSKERNLRKKPCIYEKLSTLEDKSTTIIKLRCVVCRKSFISESKLYEHQKINHFVCTNPETYKRFRCDLCSDKAYGRLNVYLEHMLTHSNLKQFICNICNKKFNRKSTLRHHMAIHSRTVHNCNVCDRDFSTTTNLTVHKRTHLEVKPYICTICNRGFHVSANLKTHLREHTGEKPYLCSECGRNFARQSNLMIHLRVHTGEKRYKCDKCPKVFSQSVTLREHKYLHTGERPFACKICDKRFFRSGVLRKHEKIHTGERNYKCVVCERTFTESRSMKRHLKLKHATQ